MSGAREDIAAFTALNRRHRATVSFWTTRIREDVAAGRRVALWGAGARGVALLNAVDPGRSLTAVVDRNPAKHGRYLPCTGHQVTDPKDLIGQQVDTVLITNPIYQGEIREQLAALGVNATIWDVSTAHRPGTTGGLSASADK